MKRGKHCRNCRFMTGVRKSRPRHGTAERPQIDNSVTCFVRFRHGLVQRWMPSRRPKKTRRGRVFPPRSVVISVFWHLFFLRRLFVVSMVWHSYGIHMAMMCVRLGRWTFSMRLGNASLSQVWSALPHPWKWNPFNNLQPSSTLQFFFNSAPFFFPKSGVASLGLCWGQKMTQTHPRQKWAVCVWTTVLQPYV